MNRHYAKGNFAGVGVCVERDPGDYTGRHRAIRHHAFVPHPRGEAFGCALPEGDEPHVRCGFYRKHHATMAAQ